MLELVTRHVGCDTAFPEPPKQDIPSLHKPHTLEENTGANSQVYDDTRGVEVSQESEDNT